MDNLDSQKQLALISEMIQQAKAEVARGGSSQILMWGWVIAGANFGHYFLEQSGFYAPFIVWLVVIPAAVVSGIMSYRHKQKGTSGHIDSVYGNIWLAAGIAILITLLMMDNLQMNHNPIIMSIAAMGMFITGKLLKFKPLMLGSFILWAAALIEWQLPIEQHYLVSGIAVILGYLIPGYMLKKSEK